MRRFLITSDKFTGTVELIYNRSEFLACVDMRQAVMTADTIAAFKRAVPVFIADMKTAFAAGTMVVEADFDVTLDGFKREYPYSRNYHLLQPIWDKMKKPDQVEAFFSAIEYRKHCEKNTWYKPMIAAWWLTRKEYKNDWRKM